MAICRKDSDETNEQIIWCDKGRVIHIISMTVGYSADLTFHNNECTISDNYVQCREPTNSRDIMRCNWRRHCSLGDDDDAFNYYPETCGEGSSVNFIEITYSCINGERTLFLR